MSVVVFRALWLACLECCAEAFGECEKGCVKTQRSNAEAVCLTVVCEGKTGGLGLLFGVWQTYLSVCLNGGRPMHARCRGSWAVSRTAAV